MEFEQIIKQVDWLDEERRKDKAVLTRMDDRISTLEGSVNALIKQVKEFGNDTARINAILARFDGVDNAMVQQRIDSKQAVDDLEKQLRKREEEQEKIRRIEARTLDTSLGEMRKELTALAEMKRAMQARVEEEQRLGKLIDEIRERLDVVKRNEEEYTRVYKLQDENRRQDAKRLTDMQGELVTIRKQMDNQRGQVELSNSNLKKAETRLNELVVLENERREAMEKFQESQALVQVERERVWKEWQARFDAISVQTADVEAALQSLDTTNRTIKRSQQAIDDLTQKLDRRINELTEVQRLAEDRLRQEWATFKSDDQKRWTNYSLTQEELRNEGQRLQDRIVDRLTNLEDATQEVQDTLEQANVLNEKLLANMLSILHEWADEHEGSVRRSH